MQQLESLMNNFLENILYYVIHSSIVNTYFEENVVGGRLFFHMQVNKELNEALTAKLKVLKGSKTNRTPFSIYVSHIC